MTRTHILLDYRCIPNIANTEDYPWGEYKVGRGVEAKIPPLEVSLLMGVSKYLIALMHVYVTQANFTTKPRFEIKNKRSFTEMNSQGSRVEKNTHAQKVQMQKILFTNEACW